VFTGIVFVLFALIEEFVLLMLIWVLGESVSAANQRKSPKSVICVLQVLPTEPEVPGSIPGSSRFSETQWVWNGVHSAS
jgi:hypothetical protein